MEITVASIVLGAIIWLIFRHPLLSLSIVTQLAFLIACGGTFLGLMYWYLH